MKYQFLVGQLVLHCVSKEGYVMAIALPLESSVNYADSCAVEGDVMF